MRLMQRAGWSRGDCERREHRMLVAMEASTVAELPIRMYDATWTIDRAAAISLPGRANVEIDARRSSWIRFRR